MVNVERVPVQEVPPLEYEGVTVMSAVATVVDVFDTAKELMSPSPLEARPMDGFELVQLKTVPVTPPVKLIGLVIAPWQRA